MALRSRGNDNKLELEVRPPPVVLLVVPRLLEVILCNHPARDVLVRPRFLREPQLPTEGFVRSHDEEAFFPGQKVESIYIHENSSTQRSTKPVFSGLYSTCHAPGLRDTADLQTACPRKLLFVYSACLRLCGSGNTSRATQEDPCLLATSLRIGNDCSGSGCLFHGAPLCRRSDTLSPVSDVHYVQRTQL